MISHVSQNGVRSHRWWNVAAILALVVVDAEGAVCSVLAHSFREGFEENCTFEAHLPNGACETRSAEPDCVGVVFHLVLSAAKLDTFLLVGFFDRWWKSRGRSCCVHCAV